MKSLLDLFRPRPKIDRKEVHFRRLVTLLSQGRRAEASQYYMDHQSISHRQYALAVAEAQGNPKDFSSKSFVSC